MCDIFKDNIRFCRKSNQFESFERSSFMQRVEKYEADMKIRRFRETDAGQASELIREIYLNQKLGEYSPAIIHGQIEDNAPHKLVENSRSTRYFLAVDKNEIVGIGGYDSMKVRTMFVRIDRQNEGVGKRLLSKILREAKKEGISQLGCWSTLRAETFYGRFGFVTLGELSLPYRNETLVFKEMVISL